MDCLILDYLSGFQAQEQHQNCFSKCVDCCRSTIRLLLLLLLFTAFRSILSNHLKNRGNSHFQFIALFRCRIISDQLVIIFIQMSVCLWFFTV